MINECGHHHYKWETVSLCVILPLVVDLGKLRTFWEDQVHMVVARKGEGSAVYDARPESSEGPTRTLHRNLLLPCDCLPGKHWEDLPPVKKTRTAAPFHCDDVFHQDMIEMTKHRYSRSL